MVRKNRGIIETEGFHDTVTVGSTRWPYSELVSLADDRRSESAMLGVVTVVSLCSGDHNASSVGHPLLEDEFVVPNQYAVTLIE